MLRIGALTTYTEIITVGAVVAGALPMLVAAAREIGAVQIQNRGTLGGNIANGSPAGDTLPVLAAADALVELRSAGLGAEGAVHGLLHRLPRERAAARRAHHGRRDPAPSTGRQWFRKVGTRAAQAISKVVMAAVRADRAAHRVRQRRADRRPRAAHRGRAGVGRVDRRGPGASCRRRSRPIDDIRSTAAYRRRVAANLLAEFWNG